MYTTILTLFKQGKGQREISRITGHNRRTVKKIIYQYQTKDIQSPPQIKKTSKLDKYYDQIIKYLEKDLSKIRIHEELLKENNDLEIGYSSLSRYISKIKVSNNICVRFHTEIGDEAQVDFGYVDRQPDSTGKLRKAWVFNMRLSYSRLDYYEVVFDQKVETFINCHKNAFKYFGGVPKTVKIDNLKSAILEAGFYESIYQGLYKRFADFYGFYPLPCRVRKPQEKGKVESGIKYIKNNFFAGRSFKTFDSLNTQLKEWMGITSNRIHGTTKEKPSMLFEEEKTFLNNLPEHDFKTGLLFLRKVAKDCHITIDNNYYSVPYEYVSKEVEVEINDSLVKISFNNDQIALHSQSKGKGNFITQTSHYPKYKNYTSDSEEYLSKYHNKMKEFGDDANNLFLLIVQEHPREWYRIIKGILNLEKNYSKEAINLSCKRALVFSITKYSKIKSICKSGCYNLPLPSSPLPIENISNNSIH